MNKVFQLWGLKTDDGLNEERVKQRLDRLLAVKPDYVVAGQSSNAAFLREICDRAHRAGVKVHQWSSLFSEYDDAADYDPLLGADGLRQQRVYGDNFNFRCPASEKNVRLFIDMQRKHMAGADFDGVFLDRVRYPSMSNGALACFCPDCVKRYEQAGLNVENLRRIHHFGQWENGRFIWADAETEAFFRLRMQSITHAVEMLRDAFGEVSLDLFPPALMPLVGQDFDALLPLAAFVKPMLYLYTTAPAGLPFEMDAFAPHAGSMPSAAEQVRMLRDARIYWGIESAMIPGVAEMTPERIEQSIALVAASGGEGICAAWNVGMIPEENFEVFCRA